MKLDFADGEFNLIKLEKEDKTYICTPNLAR